MLKKLFVYILLISFAIRPFFFVGQVLYYHLNIDYIIETYCINTDKPELQCNGKCHLSKQLNLAKNEESEDNSNSEMLFEAFYPLYFQNITIKFSEHSEIIISAINNWSFDPFMDSGFIESTFHPPDYLS